MKFTIQKEEFEPVLSSAHAIAGGRNIIAILGCVKIDAVDGLTVTATDMDIAIARVASADVEAPGSICVPIAQLFPAVKALPANSQIQCEVTKDRMIVKAGRSRFTINVMPAADFPVMEIVDSGLEIKFEAGELSKIISKVKYAAYDGDVQMHLSSVLMTSRDGGLRAVSLSQNRMALSDLSVECEGLSDIIIPISMAQFIEREALPASTMRVSGTKIAVEFPGTTIAGKAMDAQFPQFMKAFDAAMASNVNRAIVNRASLIDAVTRVAIASNVKTRLMRIDLASGKMTLSTRGDMDGLEDVPCHYEGDEYAVGINAGFMAQALAALDTEDVEIFFSNPVDKTPHLINPNSPNFAMIGAVAV